MDFPGSRCYTSNPIACQVSTLDQRWVRKTKRVNIVDFVVFQYIDNQIFNMG